MRPPFLIIDVVAITGSAGQSSLHSGAQSSKHDRDNGSSHESNHPDDSKGKLIESSQNSTCDEANRRTQDVVEESVGGGPDIVNAPCSLIESWYNLIAESDECNINRDPGQTATMMLPVIQPAGPKVGPAVRVSLSSQLRHLLIAKGASELKIQ